LKEIELDYIDNKILDLIKNGINSLEGIVKKSGRTEKVVKNHLQNLIKNKLIVSRTSPDEKTVYLLSLDEKSVNYFMENLKKIIRRKPAEEEFIVNEFLAFYTIWSRLALYDILKQWGKETVIEDNLDSLRMLFITIGKTLDEHNLRKKFLNTLLKTPTLIA
jgi:DNA-binding MarR family transcriptional regulator